MIVYHTPEGEIIRWSSSGMGDLPGLTALVCDLSEPWRFRVVDGAPVEIPPSPFDHGRFDFGLGEWVLDDAAAATEVRAERTRRLAASDWTQVSDAPVDQAAWAAYRAALRDVPQQPGFPHSVIWPERPQHQEA